MSTMLLLVFLGQRGPARGLFVRTIIIFGYLMVYLIIIMILYIIFYVIIAGAVYG